MFFGTKGAKKELKDFLCKIFVCENCSLFFFLALLPILYTTTILKVFFSHNSFISLFLHLPLLRGGAPKSIIPSFFGEMRLCLPSFLPFRMTIQHAKKFNFYRLSIWRERARHTFSMTITFPINKFAEYR